LPTESGVGWFTGVFTPLTNIAPSATPTDSVTIYPIPNGLYNIAPEAFVPATAQANYTATFACTGDDAALTDSIVTATDPKTATSSIRVGTSDVGKDILCTFTNTGSSLIVNKALDGTGRVGVGDQFTLEVHNGAGAVLNDTSAQSTTAGEGATVTAGTGTTGMVGFQPNTPYRIVERMATGSTSTLQRYAAKITCQGTNSTDGAMTGLPTGESFSPASGYTLTVPEAGQVMCTVTNGPVPSTTLAGTVFVDNGIGGGTANDGVRNGGETILAGVRMRLTDCAGTEYGRTVTDSAGQYTLDAGAVPTGTLVCVEQTNLDTYISTRASFNNTVLPNGVAVSGYTYTRPATHPGSPDTIKFQWDGTARGGLDFGDVPDNLWVGNGEKTGLPGSTVSYAHTFTAGTSGTVAFSLATIDPQWAATIFADPGCTGSLQAGAARLYPPKTPAIAVAAGDVVCVVVQQFIPASARMDETYTATVRANFSYLVSGVPAVAHSLDDVTTVSQTALSLKKEVRNVTTGGAFAVTNQAKPGHVLEYRITYTNNAPAAITDLVVSDTTPAYSTFVSSDVDNTPATLSACTKNTPANASPAAAVPCADAQPAGGTGALNWVFTGALGAGESGQVLFQVRVD
jgi:trimeric autotransporter adhesin